MGGVSERTKSHKSSNEKVPINGFVLDVVCATRTYMCTIYKSINVPVVLNDLFFFAPQPLFEYLFIIL